ncbi:Hypothetical protein ORPV_116 [Orpheovirus IHUMI-LCC2]|uniref:Uncharacterized protein n=1 Tax=Orpheovirus IHUMI-LCC2 TaxID=2023057 RepID=A0A2I2L3D1_9VIRU|nr:Hypothetical protein ORPV_116 [Orpheovirus IHUMI-LCC2]SNW62020.1 Hypothetical protein ORPV_116 [Orpheovirus IHUMI-LCC2]
MESVHEVNIKIGEFTLKFGRKKIEDTIYCIIKRFKELENNNILEIVCPQLDNKVIFQCLNFLSNLDVLTGGYPTTVILNNTSYTNIKLYINVQGDNMFPYYILIILEYFSGNISCDILACLYICCVQRGIKITDATLMRYIQNGIKVIVNGNKFRESMLWSLLKCHIVHEYFYINKEWNDIIEKSFEGKLEYNIDGYLQYIYYPKDINSNINNIIKDKEKSLQIKYKCKLDLSNKVNGNNIHSYIEEKKRWVSIGKNVILDSNCRNNKYELKLEKGTVEILDGFICYKLYCDYAGLGRPSHVFIVPGDLLYNKLFNPSIEEVCNIFREMVLNRK